jgi:hypothetical protein
MITGFQHLHSYLAYIVLAALLIAFLYLLVSHINNREFGGAQRKAALLGLVFAHIQFLIGIVLYFISPLGFSNLSAETMKDSFSRLYALEHPLMMLFGVALITIGYARAKRQSEGSSKYRTLLTLYGIGLIFMLSRIPWQSWLNL